jgi:hypothetical protein
VQNGWLGEAEIFGSKRFAVQNVRKMQNVWAQTFCKQMVCRDIECKLAKWTPEQRDIGVMDRLPDFFFAKVVY